MSSELRNFDDWVDRITKTLEGRIALKFKGIQIIDDLVYIGRYEVSSDLKAVDVVGVVVKQGEIFKKTHRYWFIYERGKKLLLLFLYPYTLIVK